MRSILTHPDVRLRRMSNCVNAFDASLEALLKELELAMRAGPGGVGIAAPQIGELKRAIVVDCRQARKSCRHHGLLHMANPEILHAEGEALGREGCLSVPDWVGMVPRARMVRVRYQNLLGESHTIESTGFEARVIQHEIDHLNGILFINRVISIHDLLRRLPGEA
ncbi:MAG: peptide deformylase [Mariprofundaceae bacterium]